MARKTNPRLHLRRGGTCRWCGSDLSGRDGICPCRWAAAATTTGPTTTAAQHTPDADDKCPTSDAP